MSGCPAAQTSAPFDCPYSRAAAAGSATNQPGGGEIRHRSPIVWTCASASGGLRIFKAATRPSVSLTAQRGSFASRTGLRPASAHRFRIIESHDREDREPDVSWGWEERAEERERIRGYIRASLVMLSTERGGRKTPFASGYRPQWDLGTRTEDGRISTHDAEVWLEDALTLDPGDAAVIRLHPFFPEFWEDVGPGSVISLYEGNRKLGEARVIEVVPAAETSA
jgi:hypothetical protein